jgi:hypothetical protein
MMSDEERSAATIMAACKSPTRTYATRFNQAIGRLSLVSVRCSLLNSTSLYLAAGLWQWKLGFIFRLICQHWEKIICKRGTKHPGHFKPRSTLAKFPGRVVAALMRPLQPSSLLSARSFPL